MNITGLEVLSDSLGRLAIGAVPPEKVELTYGNTLKVNVFFAYRGKAGTATLYGAIGNRGIVFDEILIGQVMFDLPESPAFTPCVASVDILITAAISPGTDYDLYVKLKEYPGAGYPEVDDIITITGVLKDTFRGDLVVVFSKHKG